MAGSNIPADLHELCEVHEWRHASAVLTKDFPEEWKDVCEVLRDFRLFKSRIVIKGGSKSLIAAALDAPLTKLGWSERQFKTEIHIDDTRLESPTHKVDWFKTGSSGKFVLFRGKR